MVKPSYAAAGSHSVLPLFLVLLRRFDFCSALGPPGILWALKTQKLPSLGRR